ncbi:MAG TPA: NAD(P)/FAD-dependent oxidoreductase [Nitrospirota bacterium]|nr:NAD(P)/FAD-dependent oxidoreductase [Nitrospirota bacterium]
MTSTSPEPMPSACDVVVIGAGIAGLTASALLAKSGLKVALVEEQPQPGGYLVSFRRKGYVFDSSIQWLNQCNARGLVNRVFRHIAPDFPVCRNMKRIHRYKGKSFDYVLTSEPEKLRDQLIRDHPEDRQGIVRFFEDCRRIGMHFDKLNLCMRVIETMTLQEKLRFGLKMTRWTAPVWKYFRMPAEEGVNLYFRTEGMKKLFCSEEKFMSMIMPVCWAYTGDIQSPPDGGTGVFADWLCRQIEAASSRVILNSAVEKILLENGRAAGVRLSNGHRISSQYVIATCDLQHLYENMLPAGVVPDRLMRDVRKADLYPSGVNIFLGLDCDIAGLGLHEELTCITEECANRTDHSGKDPHKISLIVQAPSVRDPSLAPQGKSTLTIHTAAWMDYEDNWKTDEGLGRGKAYREFKEQYAQVLISRVEKAMGVDLRKHIEVMEVATPVTYWRYSRNRGGTTMGQKPTMKNITSRVAHYHTPVKNLLLGGHWAEYGGGVPIAVKAAANASLLILQEMKKKEFHELRDVLDGKTIMTSD